MSFTLKILGCSSATPTTKAHPSAQILNMEEKLFLIDCGEGTQVQLRKYKVRFSKIDHIFISHLHGDHFFGLIGLVSSFHTLNRGKDLHIYSPKGLKEIIITQLKITKTQLSYYIHFHELKGNEPILIHDDKKLTVTAIPLKHRIKTFGYLFEEKQKERKLNMDAVLNHEVEVCDYRGLKLGKDYTDNNGNVIDNSVFTSNPSAPLKYAYCSDTAYYPEITKWIKGVDLLYHESTFLDELKELAIKTGHSTVKDAVLIAKEAEAKNLLLGHFSARYPNREVFLEEAKLYFNNVEISEKGKDFIYNN
ncbi:MAG: ribonuclease Z [Ichthyobacteriaceae bacterium]|nr:ribonuclease Z [Ichthyobacteriaceae bacterium]